MSAPEPTLPPVVVAAPATAVPPPGMRALDLPEGITIACQSRMEAEHIHEDLFDKKIYLRHGITLTDGMCLFDVGGNIGLFTLYVHLRCRDVLSYTFEPAPPLFEILRYNASLHAPGARLVNAGASDRRRTAELTFYPYSSGMSSFHADLSEEKAILRSILEHQAAEGRAGLEDILASSDELLDARFTSQTYRCPLVPLSEVIDAWGVEVIDLLKVDVQKSELEVLQGIEERHWGRVRQVVGEVHDLDGKLAALVGLLERQGFRVVVEQDTLLTGSVLYNFFAISREALGATSGGAGSAPQRGFLQREALRRQRRPQGR